jgi:adenine-specific DNA-methyltransferase
MNIETLGQVFTQNHTVDLMLKLRKNNGYILEPSCGNGAISNRIPNCLAVEIDESVRPKNSICVDFFKFQYENKFDTIIGNPPFVKYSDIMSSTKELFNDGYSQFFDERANLYMFFICKCLFHLKNKGELIFINPREFLKATSSIKLNNLLFNFGTITDVIDMGDSKIFGDFTPNCIIWRFELGNFSRKTNYSTAKIKNNKLEVSKKEIRKFTNINGQLMFLKSDKTVLFKDLFYVKVGAVSGADSIYMHEKGNKEFVSSETRKTNKIRKMFYNVNVPELLPYKESLLNRRIKKFDENNWYMWGRGYHDTSEKRIYVNCKTRQNNPFFTHKCKNYDGSVLAIFPKNQSINIDELASELNKVDWNELGFICGDRFIFSQKSLENCVLPDSFAKLLK